MEYEGAQLNVGWQLGAILYEINALPWTFTPKTPSLETAPRPPLQTYWSGEDGFFLVTLSVVSALVGAALSRRTFPDKSMANSAQSSSTTAAQASPMVELPSWKQPSKYQYEAIS